MRGSNVQQWPTAMASEEAAPVLSHWNAAKQSGSGALWPTSPQWLTRYVDQLRTSHASSVISAARELRKRLMQR